MMLKLKKATLTVVAVFTMGGGLISIPPQEVSARTTYVWIAPNHGKRYHYSKNCRGLNTAGYKRHVTRHWARSHGYRLCHWEK
ncbi:hypothetical protein HCC74_04660 [Lentilactobacillus parabuchneri]|uniref:Uncharacterized protein n=2 Tax=Lentilactobacillus parabuchneri TaxID=152331 RepID=A0A844EAK5_9LACO|nr:hypothetical protein [Lentilactobacillus parabuchneri]MSE19997.1 hypothetical protein [Lentilactobacillus parabuchneri]OBU96896.1 hypothetical protein A7B51_07765 [Lentilactobacillus parabuchneri]OCB79335.1 hypothetical protein A8O18_08900 [Lentilactobacillus parabuchneri]OCB83733.1 hypothetical protein A7322_09685 [Lentilactobacillus parabuchneri]